MAKVLLIDIEMTMMQMVGELLRSDGHQVIPFTSAIAAAERLGAVGPDLVVAHLGLERSPTAGVALLQKARASNPPALVIMIMPAGSLELAIETMKRGAYDYLNKPFTLGELKLRVQRALSYRDALAENLLLRKQVQPDSHFQEIVGRSPRLQELLNVVQQAADCDLPILLSGEPGSGKQLFARAIHLKSRRRLAPFLPFGCGGASENRLEAELFGNPKGSNNGDDEKPSLLQEAEGGTVFLDDVGRLSQALQDRLLDALRNKVIPTPGETTLVTLDVRIIAASCQALEQKVAEGSFRRELFERLSEIRISVPPLRERAEDIPLLISHFLQGKIHPRSNKPYIVSAEAFELCRTYAWPGNVQELQSVLEQACMVCQDGTIQKSDLARLQPPSPPPAPALPAGHQNGYAKCAPVQADVRRVGTITPEHSSPLLITSEGPVPLKKFLRDQEINYLHQTLAQVDGSKERAAELLGISLATIYRKLSEPEPVSETV